MQKSFFACLALLAVGGIWIGISAARGLSAREVKITGGRSTIGFLPSVLDSNNLKLSLKGTAEPDYSTPETTTGFRIDEASLEVKLVDARVYRFEGGTVEHDGGFKLASGDKTLDATDFAIVSEGGAEKRLKLQAHAGGKPLYAFNLVNPRTLYDVKQHQLIVQGMDMQLSREGAEALGRPELEGTLIGGISVFADSEPIDGGGEIESPRIEASVSSTDPIDLSISSMGSLTVMGRLGTFPNGRNGFSMSTTSCNVGTQEVPWNAPMQVTHPTIAMQLYRLKDGRFEEIGWSWMKHGFFATNSNGCVGGCLPSQQGGSMLGTNCSDTYGTTNNGDRNYLGGRDEVNPFTGVWTCTNSYFSNFQNDCQRRRPTSGEFSSDPVTHRLEVLDADLNVSGAQYFYEAFYIDPNEQNVFNNISSREATITWGGSSWGVSTVGGFVPGPAINRWGDMRSFASPQAEGGVIIAAQTTNLPGGMYHYEYAVYNQNLDRQLRTFSVPVPTNAIVQNIGFHDVDQDAGNNWQPVVSNESITWSTAAFGSSSANPLKFASIFNFRFDSNAAPASSAATLGLFKPGTGTQLTAATKGPLVLKPVESFQLLNGANFGGNLLSLAFSDDDKLVVGPTFEGARGATGILAIGTVPAGAVTSLTVGVESKNSLPSNVNPRQTIELWNWNTQAWELVDSRATTQTDALALVAITSSATRFVNGTSHEVRARIMQDSDSGVSGERWQMSVDQVGFHLN